MLRLKIMRRFLYREDGSATLFVAMGSLLLIGATGIAIDMSRVQTAQSRMSSALDAAGLAAGNALSSGNVDTITKKYFWANYPSGYMGSTVNDPTLITNNDKTLIKLDVAGTVPTTFMKIFGKTSIPIKAHSEITRANQGLELVLVMDTTGSMTYSAGGGVSKIQAAKNAATDLINILYGTQSTLDNVWVGMVPFAQAVNVGTSHANWTSNPVNLPWYGWGTTSWSGCVDAREAGGNDVTDTPPGGGTLFPKYFWPDDNMNNNWVGGSSNTSTVCDKKSSCICSNYNNCSCVVSGFTQTCYACNGSGNNKSCTATATTVNFTINNNTGPNKSCSQTVTPLTANKNNVLNAISTLTPNGYTHIVLGASWAWRMLSPNWKNLWGGEMDSSGLPLAYNTPLMSKVVILMTDGDNTMTSKNATSSNTPSRGAYWYVEDGKLVPYNAGQSVPTNIDNAVTELNARTTQTCNGMKQKGVIIYTIAFGTDIDAASQTMLKNCATSLDHYFYSPTAASLSNAFHQIGDSLANLHVSQ